MSVVTFEKPAEHLALPAWYKRTQEMGRITEKEIQDSFNLRSESVHLCKESKLRTKWDTYINDTHLQNRYSEVSKWYELLVQSNAAVENEILTLGADKAKKELELEQLATHLNIVAECIHKRDSRLGSDLVFMDQADAALKKELAGVECLKRMLLEKCEAAWEQLNKLKEIQFTLQLDIGNKKTSLEVDSYNLQMTKDCEGISFKPDPLRIPTNCIPYETWMEVSTLNKENAEKEIVKSRKLREDMFCTKEITDFEMLSKQEETDSALRLRIYDVQKEKNELQWQRLRLTEEMEKMLKEIETLTSVLSEKTNAVKLAETRLENRLFRPGPELVQDYAQNSLKDEVQNLHQTRNDLSNKIYSAKAKYNQLEEHLIHLEENIANKQNSMMIDVRCLEMRDVLRGTQSGCTSQMTLTRMEDEIPKKYF